MAKVIRIAGINDNDICNGEDICVSLFLQGCPFHCKGCHNPETWDPQKGQEYEIKDLIKKIIELISANGITRNLSILGGETLDTIEKIKFINKLIKKVKKVYPEIKIHIWTGYIYEDIKDKKELQYIFQNIDYLIDGPFVIAQRDITLKWRGSRNQRIVSFEKFGEK